MKIPAGFRFTREHEWIETATDACRVGISEYAQNELGDVVFVELPEVGKEVKKGESFCNVESVKAVSDVYAPVDGRIVEVNTALGDNPEILNASPYEEGWIIKLQPTASSQLEALQSAAEYESYIATLSK